jgi:hypothetical protein
MTVQLVRHVAADPINRAIVPAPTAKDPDPPIPASKRNMMRTGRLLDAPAIAVKIKRSGMVVQYMERRPYSSDRGAANMGPIVKPRVYRDRGRTASSLPTLKRIITSGIAET